MESASAFLLPLIGSKRNCATCCNQSGQTCCFFNQSKANTKSRYSVAYKSFPAQPALETVCIDSWLVHYANSLVVIDKSKLQIGSYDFSSWPTMFTQLLLNDSSDRCSLKAAQSEVTVAGCFRRNSSWSRECHQECCQATARRSSRIKEFREQVIVGALKEVSHRDCSGRLFHGGLFEPASKFK